MHITPPQCRNTYQPRWCKLGGEQEMIAWCWMVALIWNLFGGDLWTGKLFNWCVAMVWRNDVPWRLGGFWSLRFVSYMSDSNTNKAREIESRKVNKYFNLSHSYEFIGVLLQHRQRGSLMIFLPVLCVSIYLLNVCIIKLFFTQVYRQRNSITSAFYSVRPSDVYMRQ